jgi:DNA polymerase III epsilon subunit-like protein
MTDTEWILLDTETSGVVQPIYCVELAAQRMRGISAVGEPFRALLNHEVEIDPMAESIHGYGRRYLQQHGRDPRVVHEEFIRYAGPLPIVAFNLSFDWKRVLAPELERLGLKGEYHPGFCALTLARRCVHETAAHGLQRLRAHFFPYHRGAAHRALDDVAVTIRLVAEVLWPRLERAGIRTFAEVATFSRATPIAECRQRLSYGSSPAAERKAASVPVDLEAELQRQLGEFAERGSLGMRDVDGLRRWLADHRQLQSDSARGCRGLVEIAFGEDVLMPEDLADLKRRLGRLKGTNVA